MEHKMNTYWKNVLTIVPIVGAGVATMIYLLRLYCRRMKAVGLQLEDYLMGVGLIISFAVTAFVVDSEYSFVFILTMLTTLTIKSRLQWCRSPHRIAPQT